MINLDLGKENVGEMLALTAKIRPQAVFALVTLGDRGQKTHNLRLDLGKAAFIDHIPEIESFPVEDVKKLTEKIISRIGDNHIEEYRATPRKINITLQATR